MTDLCWPPWAISLLIIEHRVNMKLAVKLLSWTIFVFCILDCLFYLLFLITSWCAVSRSLGCIAYEITVGHPPFTTASLLQLIRMIKRDSIVWPNHLSETFLSFLKGLLQKDPSARLSWPHLIHHPFVRDKIRIVEGNPAACKNIIY